MFLKLRIVIICWVVSCIFSPYGYAEDYLTISAPPSIWAKKQGDTLTGPIIDLLEKVFSDTDIKIKYISLPWVRAVEGMKSGKLDLMPVIFYTAERAEFVEFTVPYTTVPTSIFVPKGKTFPFSSPKDLIGKNGLKMRGDSISQEFLQYEASLSLTEITSYEMMLKMLSNHRADYAVAAHYGFLVEAKKVGCETKIESLERPVATRSLHFAISKKSPYVKQLEQINKKLDQLKEDGTIESMIKGAFEMVDNS